MERTSICLDKPLLKNIRTRAHREGKTLKQTIIELLQLGLARLDKQQNQLPALPVLNLGQELFDISNRSKLYEQWEATP